jgi:PAS domain S-box-containing protein
MAKGLAAVTPAEREDIRQRWIHVGGEERRSLRVLLLAAAAALLALGALYAWNASLRRRIAAATAGLQAELGERRRAEEALRASEHKLALHLEQTLFGVIEFDAQFRVVYWNPAAQRIFGWSAAEVRGRCAPEFLVAPAARPQVDDVFRALVGRMGGQHSVNDNVDRDGRVLTCEWFNTRLVDGDGNVTGVMSLVSDVTERMQREEEAARAQRLESLAVLAGGIAHDFNNLLTGVLANVSVARTEPLPPEELAELLGETEAAARRAQTLTRQLLTFARGGAPLKQLVDLVPVVEESATFAARGGAAVVRFEPGEGVWPAEADAGQIGQVVQNLVLNAIEAMRGGGVVEVSLGNVAASAGGRPLVRIRVVDHGPGIPAELLPRIFDPFASTKARGSGLGLAVVHSIVARHGGRVEVRSRPGEGSVFDVLLPGRPEGVVGQAARPHPAGVVRGRILVMDDEEVVRRAAARVLSGMGCDVTLAADGAEAVERWTVARQEGRPFDVVLVDLTVPGGMGGVEVMEQLRAIDPGVKVIVSSGYSTSAVMAEYREHGFAAVIPKPWSADDVRRVMGELALPAA